jgi:polyhydroxybutyrate depolymerase
MKLRRLGDGLIQKGYPVAARYVLVAAFVCLSPVSVSSAAPIGDQQITVQVGVQKRTCVVHVPPSYDGKRPLPLIIAFHGAGGTGQGLMGEFRTLADREGFIAACPDGITGHNRGWTALFGKPIPGGDGAQVDDVDDVGFVRLLIDRLRNSHHTDPNRVFVCGHSAGAYLSYRVAIDLADRIAAAGVINGSMGIRLLDGTPSVPDVRKPVAPVSIIHICGAKDRTVKFEGGQTVRVLVKSVPECVKHFVEANGCTTPGRETRDAEHGVTRTLYAGGKNGTEVKLVVLENGNHNWPSAKDGLAATQEMWNFFSSHPKRDRSTRGQPVKDHKPGARESTGTSTAPAASPTINNPQAAESAPKLAPGSTFSVAFPDMPPTFYALSQKKEAKARMTIFLPSNYDTRKKLPLLIFLNGGDGGTGNELGVARSLCEGRDFICVSVPLFKAAAVKTADSNAANNGFIMRGVDAAYMWPFFKTMLTKLEEVVPNIDPAQRILGGFSNGAHATAGLLDESNGEIAQRFSAFIFVEGGGRLQHYDMLKGRPFLMVSSSAKSRPRAQQICDAAKAAGAQATLIVEDVGKHDFPTSAYPAVRNWLRGLAIK